MTTSAIYYCTGARQREILLFHKIKKQKIINDFIYPSILQWIIRKTESKCKNNTTYNVKLKWCLGSRNGFKITHNEWPMWYKFHSHLKTAICRFITMITHKINKDKLTRNNYLRTKRLISEELFTYKCGQLWNKLPEGVKLTDNVNILNSIKLSSIQL